MLMLKMLVLKMVNIFIYKYKLSLLGRDDAKQAKSLIFIVVPQVEQFQKKKKDVRILDVIRIYNNSNYKFCRLWQLVPF